MNISASLSAASTGCAIALVVAGSATDVAVEPPLSGKYLAVSAIVRPSGSGSFGYVLASNLPAENGSAHINKRALEAAYSEPDTALETSTDAVLSGVESAQTLSRARLLGGTSLAAFAIALLAALISSVAGVALETVAASAVVVSGLTAARAASLYGRPQHRG